MPCCLVNWLYPIKTQQIDRIVCLGDIVGYGPEPNECVAKVRELNETIGIPATTDVIREEDVKDLVDAALQEGSGYPTPRYLERSECEALVRGLMAA